MNSHRLLITGVRGFIGTSLAERAEEDGWLVRGALRKYDGTDGVVVGDIGSSTEWGAALEGVDVVVHLAARAHVMVDNEVDPSAAYTSVNVEGTEQLARQAASAGVRRFVFLSTIKVNGELTFEHPFCESNAPAPEDAYGISKMQAEEVLWRISRETNLEVVIVRCPLVYGPGVKGNFLSMLRLLSRGVPLPLGSVNNKRSLVALDNLVDLIITCLNHNAAANQTFFVSDDEDLSTEALLRRLGYALDRPARLISLPPSLLQWCAKLFNKEGIARRLLGNLQVDISKTKERLGWVPPVSVDEGLSKTAEWYLRQR